MNLISTILISIVITVCFIAAVAKFFNPRYTFGGKKYRTSFWSSLFFIIIGVLLITSLLVDYLSIDL